MKKILFPLSLILIFVGIVVFPIRNILFSKSLTQQSLFIFTNEAEARPCGGFITAFGEGTLFPPKFEIQNSYSLNRFDFGKNEFPLSEISERKKFWDLGVNPNMENCSFTILDTYNEQFGKDINNIIIINFSVLDTLNTILSLSNSEDFFAFLSRDVANIDRHDEDSLKERKSVLKDIKSVLLHRVWVKFWKWPEITRFISKAFKNGEIYISEISQEFLLDENDFAVLEWNLGGGKSSRMLKKTLSLFAYEKSPQKWEIQGKFTAKNLSSFDEPIGQYWKGVFEIKIPEFAEIELEAPISNLLQTKAFHVYTDIAPGDIFEYDFNFEYSGDLDDISIFKQSGQELFVDINISLYGQQIIVSDDLRLKSNTGSFFGELETRKQSFSWEKRSDTKSPFLTFHKKIPYESLPEEVQAQFDSEYFLVELHFNEEVQFLSPFSAKLIDRQFTKKDIKEDLYMVKKVEIENKTAVFLSFHQDYLQENERFYIQIKGVKDLFGNPLQKTKNTIIQR